MSAEPKVLLEFVIGDTPMRLSQLPSSSRAVDYFDGERWYSSFCDYRPALAVYDALEARHARVREAAEALVAKIGEAETALVSVCTIAAVHGFPYTGPNYEDELSALRAALETP